MACTALRNNQMTVYQADAKQSDGEPPPRMRKQNKFILTQRTLYEK